MKRATWLRFDGGSKINLRDLSRSRQLENRIVLCVDCDTNRALVVSSSAHLICLSCGSENWMFLSAPIIERLTDCLEQKSRQSTAIASHAAKFEREDSFTPEAVPF